MAHSTKPLNPHPLKASVLVRQFCQLLGLTQAQLAARMGVTLPRVNRWENDRANPSPLALLQIKLLLNDLRSVSHRSGSVGCPGMADSLFLRSTLTNQLS